MKSKIVQAVQMRYSPVVVIHTDEKPEGALQFKEGSSGCVIGMLNAVARGKTAVFDRKTFGCHGAATGLGFSDSFEEGTKYLISTGNKEFCETDLGKRLAKQIPALERGERFKKTPELAKKYYEALPLVNIPTEYIVFKPLEKLSDSETPQVVVFFVNPDQLTALVYLADYGRETNGNVNIGFSSGCQQIGILPYKESNSESPKATIGLIDISVRKSFDKDIMSFSVPYKMFDEMESNVEGSFLEEHEWLKIVDRNKL